MCAMSRTRLRLGLVIVFILTQALLGCGANVPTPCDALLVPVFGNLLAAHSDPKLIESVVSTEFQVAPQGVQTSGLYLGGYIVQWSSGGRQFYFEDAGKPRLKLKWTSMVPSLGRALECLGNPDFYQTNAFLQLDGRTTISLFLWYEARSMFVAAGHYGPSTEFSSEEKIEYITFADGNTRQERLIAAHTLGSPAGLLSMRSVRTWPGSLSGIVVESEP